MKTKKEEAVEKICSGRFNCAQAIICAYCNEAGIDEQTAGNLGNAFGAGMGCMEGTCGALVGAGVVLGLKNKDKIKSMKDMQQMMRKFQERNGTTVCKVLKGIETKQVLRKCPDCVADVAEFLEELMAE